MSKRSFKDAELYDFNFPLKSHRTEPRLVVQDLQGRSDPVLNIYPMVYRKPYRRSYRRYSRGSNVDARVRAFLMKRDKLMAIQRDRTKEGYRGVWFDPRTREWKMRDMTTSMLFGPSKYDASLEQRSARRRFGYRGPGDYTSLLNNGFRFGKAAAAAFKAGRNSWRGAGDYQGNSGDIAPPSAHVTTYGPPVDNQLIAGGNAPISVNTTSDLTGDIIFCHTEFIDNVSASSTSFQNRSYPINPGLTESFPFLAQIAKNFTLYEFNGLIYEFRPTSGEIGNASNALGKVIMACNYDPDQANFVNSRVMENYDYATAAKPSLTNRLGVETASKQSALKMNYIRTAAAGRDLIFTDVGNFQIATEGIPFTGIVGELWVTYEVKLSRANINTTSNLFGYYTGLAGPTSANLLPFGASNIVNTCIGQNVGATWANNVITFPPYVKGRTIRIELFVAGIATAATLVASTNGTLRANGVNTATGLWSSIPPALQTNTLFAVGSVVVTFTAPSITPDTVTWSVGVGTVTSISFAAMTFDEVQYVPDQDPTLSILVNYDKSKGV